MDCNSCQRTAGDGENSCGRTAAAVGPNIIDAAQNLACLLAAEEVFQNFLRSSRSVRMDAQVENLVHQINQYPGYDASRHRLSSVDDLKDELESLPVVMLYREAEHDVTSLFSVVDAIVSAAAGVPFAANAKPTACG